MPIDIAALTTRFERSLAKERDYLLKYPSFGCLAYPRTDADVEASSTFCCVRFELAEVDDERISERLSGVVLALRAAGAHPHKIDLIGFKSMGDELQATFTAPGEGVGGRPSKSAWGDWEEPEPEADEKRFTRGMTTNPVLLQAYEKEATRNTLRAG